MQAVSSVPEKSNCEGNPNSAVELFEEEQQKILTIQ